MVKTIQNFFIISILCLIASLVVIADETTGISLSRGLSDLANKYRIEDPDFGYDDNKFMLRWRVSDFVQDHMASFSIYDGPGCKEGANDITDAINDFNDNDAYMMNLGLRPDNTTLYNPSSNGEGVRDMRLFLAVQPTASNSPIFYYEDADGLKAKIEFCIRFSIHNGDPELVDQDVFEANFQETIVEFTADLTAGFSIEAVTVAPGDRTENEANVKCEIEAYECNDSNLPIENPGYLRNQGQDSVTRICVSLAQESKDEGLMLDRIMWFNWIMEQPGEVEQSAIIMDSRADPVGLTEYSCMRGVHICPFESILISNFFGWPGVSIVKGIGEGLCMFGDTSSILVEDVSRQIGTEIFGWLHHDRSNENVKRVRISGFPSGTTVSYASVDSQETTTVVTEDDSYEVELQTENGEALIRSSIDSLRLKAPAHSDVDFTLDVLVKTGDSSVENIYRHEVNVLAVADKPSVSATGALQIEEDSDPVVLSVFAGRSADDDNSETLSVVITLPSDSFGPIGTMLELFSVPNTQVIDKGRGVYEVVASGPDPETREASLNQLLLDRVAFKPRAHWAGVLLGEAGIKVDSISTEAGKAAPSNSVEMGTQGDLDTKTEKDTTYVDISAVPVVDLPYLSNAKTIVQENKGSSDSDLDLVIPIGSMDNLGVIIDDADGSQSVYFELTGFPTNAISLRFTVLSSGVTTSIDKDAGNVTLAGEYNVADVLAVLESLEITLAHDDDKNFFIELNGFVKDTNGVVTVEETFYLVYEVVVQAVADTPTLDVGTEIKTLVAENSTIEEYPVSVQVNDIDGSESFKGESVDLYLTTPTSIAVGADPIVKFAKSTGVTISTSSNRVTLTGDYTAIEAAMATLEIGPGAHNGEDITVVVKVSAVESNPTELGPDEIAVPEVQVVKQFVLPVNPEIQGTPWIPNAEVITGNEDSRFSLGNLTVQLDGIEDTDGSEKYYIELERSSFPSRTKFWVDGIRRWSNVDNWVRLPSPNSKLEIKPPPNFSGTVQLNVRGRIIDSSTRISVTKVTESQPLTVRVLPIADKIHNVPNAYGVEDNGPVAFGSILASSSGIRPRDNGGGVGNNPEKETFSQIKFEVPLDTGTLTYGITSPYAPSAAGSSSGVGTASVSMSEDSNVRAYIITSSITSNPADFGALSYEDRTTASDDIMDTLDSFQVEMGPVHTDLNGAIEVTATTLDVNLGVYDDRNNSFTHQIIIRAIADAPSIFIHATNTITTEDGPTIPLKVTVTRSDDEDGSEELSVQITVPSDSYGTIGTIVSKSGTVPSNVNLANTGNGIFLITANGDTTAVVENRLNQFVDGGDLAFKPRDNWSGNSTLKVEVISTEMNKNEIAAGQFGGADNDSEKEIALDYIGITVRPVADKPTVAINANAIGKEDTKIDVPVSVKLTDVDGSETFVMMIDSSSVPTGAKLFGQNGNEVSATGGSYILQPPDIEELQILPPLHWSSALQGTITLKTTTTVTDSSAGLLDIVSSDFDVPVTVVGVADPPNFRSVTVVATEDEDYSVGQALGNLDGILVDNDGSETLSLVLGGLPPGTFVKTSGGPAPLYIGQGEWQIERSAVPSLTITALPNYAGDNPFPNFTFRALSKEQDGDESTSEQWDVQYRVYPVADKFASWNMKVSVTESENEDSGLGVSLASANNFAFADPDGSESVVEFYFDLSNLITNAGIQKRLENLVGSGADLSDLVNNYLDGVYTFDPATRVVTVSESNVESLKLDADLFFDSNEDFEIPVSALIKDVVSIAGNEVSSTVIANGVFAANLIGTADLPTIFADSVAGDYLIPISLGGELTDTDVELGREASESLYLIVSAVDLGILPGFSFVDANNDVVGFDGGSDTWMMTKEDLASAAASGGLFFATQQEATIVGTNGGRRLQEPTQTEAPTSMPTPIPTTGAPSSTPTTSAPTSMPTPIPTTGAPSSTPTTSAPSSMPTPTPTTGAPSSTPTTSAPSSMPTLTPAVFQLMAIAVENDGDVNSRTTNFEVSFWTSGGTSTPATPIDAPKPEIPEYEIGQNEGVEDVPLNLDISARAAPNDLSNPTISVVFSNIPQGAAVIGPYFKNFVTGTFVALAVDVAEGKVKISPPSDFSGSLPITVEIIAVNANHEEATTGSMNIDLWFEPVADGVMIDIPGLAGKEDQQIPLPVAITPKGGESPGANAYIQVCADATLSGNYATVLSSDSDATIGEEDVTGFHRVPIAEVSNLSMDTAQYWHGKCDITVVAFSVESNADLKADRKKFACKVDAVANAPVITATGQVSGTEDNPISLTGLSAALVDDVVENGYESLFVVFTEVPEQSSFNHGLFSGNGRWSIPLDKLSSLQYTPPPHESGSFSIKFNAIALELDGRDEATSSSTIQVDVDPVADDFLIVAKNIGVGTEDGEASSLDINIRLIDENENVTLTFESVPAGMIMRTSNGGNVVDNGDDSWTFSGSMAASNALEFVSNSSVSTGTFEISVSGFTTDGSSTLDTPKTDNFVLTVVQEGSRVLQFSGIDDELDLKDNLSTVDFAEDPSGTRNCGSDLTVQWDSADDYFQLPQGSISTETQAHSSVGYNFTHKPFSRNVDINWVAVLYPDNPQGYTQCTVQAFSDSSQLPLTGNCFDYRSTAYIFYNIESSSNNTLSNIGDLTLPTNCQLPDGFSSGEGLTVGFKVSIPCSACTDGILTPDIVRQRKLSYAAAPFKSRHSNRIFQNIHMKKKLSRRSLQGSLEIPASEDDDLLRTKLNMELLLSGDSEMSRSSAPPVASFSWLPFVITSLSLSLLLMSS